MTIRKRPRTRFIVLHTAAWSGDFDVEVCRAWHTARGWKCEGYNYIVKKDGTIQETLRGKDGVGAHCRGVNSESIGICLAGDGDKETWTDAQVEAVYPLLLALMEEYNVKLFRVIGHREIGEFKHTFSTNKTCPGDAISMWRVRMKLKTLLQEKSP